MLMYTPEAGNDKDREADLDELETLLDARIRHAEKKGVSQRTVGEIFEEAYREADYRHKA